MSVLFGSVYGVHQAAMYALAGQAAVIMNIFNLGISISGLAVNFLRIIVLATVTSNTVGAQIFFYTSGVYLIVCSFLAWKFVNEYQEDQNKRSTLIQFQSLATPDENSAKYADDSGKEAENEI